MSANAVRSGDPIAPTVTAAGSDDDLTDPRILTFSEPVRPCLVSNHCTNTFIVVKVNKTTTNDFDHDGADDDGLGYLTVAAGETVDVSQGGRISVTSVSLASKNAGDAVADVSVVGWKAR